MKAYISSADACSLASTVTVAVFTTPAPAAFCSAALARASPGGAGEYLVATGVLAPDAPGETGAMSLPLAATSCFGNSLNFEMRTGASEDWRKDRKSEGVEDHSNWRGRIGMSG